MATQDRSELLAHVFPSQHWRRDSGRDSQDLNGKNPNLPILGRATLVHFFQELHVRIQANAYAVEEQDW
jgi:hypothetical protein